MKILIKRKAVYGFVLCFVFFVNTIVKAEFLDDTAKPSPLKNKSSQSVVHELQRTYRQIYELYKDSVVFISTTKTIKMRYDNPFFNDPFFKNFFDKDIPKERKRISRGLGTGFIISSDGYICTNHHVIDKIDSVKVKVGEHEYNARVVGSDSMTDIALLKIEGNGFKPVHFGNSDDVQIGDLAIAIGNPFGLDRTFTSGIISAVGRKGLDILGNSHIQTDTPINQGNSGGPLINLDGEVIGVNRAIYSKTGGSIGIGFAIPINHAHATLLELKKYGKVRRAYMGVQIANLNQAIAKKLGLVKPYGALVGGVEKNGPADKAGIQKGDVITAINDKEIKNYRDLILEVTKVKIGSNVKVRIFRNKKNITLNLYVVERPAR